MRVPGTVALAACAALAAAAAGAPVVLRGQEPDVLNLVPGLALLVAGAQLTLLGATRIAGYLLLVASAAWFVPDLAHGSGALETVLLSFSLAHVVPLVAALLVLPEGRLVRQVDVGVVVLAAVAAASAVTGGFRILVPAVGVALLAAGMTVLPPRPPRPPGAVLTYRLGLLSTACALTAVPLLRATIAPGRGAWLFGAYACLLTVTAITMVRVGPSLRGSAALDVGPDALLALDDRIAEVTRDPEAHAVVRLDEQRWVRLDGSPAEAPPPTLADAVPVARLPVPSRFEANVAQGLRLASENVLARHALGEKVEELASVRTRLVRVEEAQREELVTRLRMGPLASLAALRDELTRRGGSPDLLDQIRGTERDLERVAQGLDPLEGSGSLAQSLQELGAQMDAAVDVDPAVDALVQDDRSIGRALWYSSSEALTNSMKHAPAGSPRVRVRVERGIVVLVVTDGGPGPGSAAESGLVGVRDRVGALGGQVRVADAQPGTQVEVRLPTTRQHLAGSRAGADAPGGAGPLASTPSTWEVSS